MDSVLKTWGFRTCRDPFQQNSSQGSEGNKGQKSTPLREVCLPFGASEPAKQGWKGLVLMPFVEAQEFGSPNTLTKKQWRRWRLLLLPFLLFMVGPAIVFVLAPFCLLGLSISYFVDRKISPESVSRKPFHVKAWNWFKSFARWCARFWSEGPTIDGNWDSPKQAPTSFSGKTLPCSVCGKPVQVPAKYGRAKTATCSDCSPIKRSLR